MTFVDDARWRERVEVWMRDASLIVLTIGESDGIQWEIDHVLSRGYAHKTVFCVPIMGAMTDRRRSDWWRRRVAVFGSAELSQIDSDALLRLRSFVIDEAGGVRCFAATQEKPRASFICAVAAIVDLVRSGRPEAGAPAG